MSDISRTNSELLIELESLRARIAVLEQAETVHRRNDAELQDSLAYLESIFDTAHECLIVLDTTLVVRTANRSFYQAFNINLQQTVGQQIWQLGQGEWDIPELHELLENILKDNSEARDFELKYHLSSTDQRTLLLNARQLYYPDRAGDMILLAINDISERKRAEEAMAQYAHELARSNEELEQFAYVASHDLQEPLRMVTSYLQLLEKRYKYRLDPEADKFIGYAVDGAARMKSLITDLLAFSRAESRGLQYTRTDCNAVLARALGNLKPVVDETHAEISSQPLPTLRVDGGQLVQVFQNLVSNAIKFHSSAPPKIEIAAEEKDGKWLFIIKDNGIGIEPQYLDRIFVLFRRLHGLMEYPGTGIGLAICRKIVERHGGRIWAESEPGAGSTFYFTIPVSSQGK
jgi:PAS domain S-box-containing protein